MATLALAVGGAALGGSVAGSLGFAAGTSAFGITVGAFQVAGALGGTFLDQTILFPLIFGSKTQSGPKLDDIRFSQAAEGAPCPFAWGNVAVRGRCQVLDMLDEYRKIVEEDKVGGKGGGGSQKIKRDVYYTDLTLEFHHRPSCNLIKLFAGQRLVYDAALGVDKRYVEEVAISLGDQTDPDPILASYRPDSPPYKGRSTVSIRNLCVTEFGNVPPDFAAIFAPASGFSVGEAIRIIASESGFPGEIDVSGVPGCLRGLYTEGMYSPADLIETIMTAHDLESQPRGRKVAVYLASDVDEVEVDADDIAVRPEGSPDPAPLPRRERSERELPAYAACRFVDHSTDTLETGAVRSRRAYRISRQPLVVALDSMTLEPDEAAGISDRILSRAWGQDGTSSVSLPFTYRRICPGDRLLISNRGETVRAKVVRLTRGVNGQILADLSLERPGEAAAVSAPDGNGSAPSVYIPPALTAVYANLPALSTLQGNAPAFYAFVSPSDAEAKYAGAVLYQDVGTGLASAGAFPDEATIGTASVSAAGPRGMWDNLSTVEIELLRDHDLASAAPSDVRAGANRAAFIDGSGRLEVFAFRDVEQTGERAWTLSGLLRGRGRTPILSGAGTFVLLDSTDPLPVEVDVSRVGSVRTLRAVAAGDSVSYDGSAEFRPTGLNVRCRAPIGVSGTRDGSNNLTIGWTRVARVRSRIFGRNACPLLESSERYEVDILDGGTVVRTIHATGPSASYSATEQSADFGSPQANVNVRIYQVGDLLGRGEPAEATV